MSPTDTCIKFGKMDATDVKRGLITLSSVLASGSASCIPSLDISNGAAADPICYMSKVIPATSLATIVTIKAHMKLTFASL